MKKALDNNFHNIFLLCFGYSVVMMIANVIMLLPWLSDLRPSSMATQILIVMDLWIAFPIGCMMVFWDYNFGPEAPSTHYPENKLEAMAWKFMKYGEAVHHFLQKQYTFQFRAYFISLNAMLWVAVISALPKIYPQPMIEQILSISVSMTMVTAIISLMSWQLKRLLTHPTI